MNNTIDDISLLDHTKMPAVIRSKAGGFGKLWVRLRLTMSTAHSCTSPWLMPSPCSDGSRPPVLWSSAAHLCPRYRISATVHWTFVYIMSPSHNRTFLIHTMEGTRRSLSWIHRATDIEGHARTHRLRRGAEYLSCVLGDIFPANL